jgi:hypothetical protein
MKIIKGKLIENKIDFRFVFGRKEIKNRSDGSDYVH